MWKPERAASPYSGSAPARMAIALRKLVMSLFFTLQCSINVCLGDFLLHVLKKQQKSAELCQAPLP